MYVPVRYYVVLTVGNTMYVVLMYSACTLNALCSYYLCTNMVRTVTLQSQNLPTVQQSWFCTLVQYFDIFGSTTIFFTFSFIPFSIN